MGLCQECGSYPHEPEPCENENYEHANMTGDYRITKNNPYTTPTGKFKEVRDQSAKIVDGLATAMTPEISNTNVTIDNNVERQLDNYVVVDITMSKNKQKFDFEFIKFLREYFNDTYVYLVGPSTEQKYLITQINHRKCPGISCYTDDDLKAIELIRNCRRFYCFMASRYVITAADNRITTTAFIGEDEVTYAGIESCIIENNEDVTPKIIARYRNEILSI